MLFVFTYVACALPHAPRFEARGDVVSFKKLSKRHVWGHGELPWRTRRFWKHTSVDLACTELKDAWEHRNKDSIRVVTLVPFHHRYITRFRGGYTSIGEIIFDDSDVQHEAAGKYIELLREQKASTIHLCVFKTGSFTILSTSAIQLLRRKKMRFSSALKFNAVADWWDDYIAYDTLKRCIYQLEKQLYATRITHLDSESAALLHLSSPQDADAIFVPLLDRELDKISEFYVTQEKEMAHEFQDIHATVKRLEERGIQHGYRDYLEDEDEDEDEDDESISRSPVGRRRTSSAAALASDDEPSSPKLHRAHFQLPSNAQTHPRRKSRSTSVGAFVRSLRDSFSAAGPSSPTDPSYDPTTSIWSSTSNYAYDTRLLLKRRLTKLYISLTNLRSYAELNYTGFRKIIKKYDKVISSHLEQSYFSAIIPPSTPFCQASREKLSETINALTGLYAKCITTGELASAQSQLKAHQREQIAWERDTVWRLMIGRERRGEMEDIGAGRKRGAVSVPAAVVGGGAEETIDVEETGGGATLVRVREPPPALFRIPVVLPRRGRIQVVKLRVTKRRLWLAVSVASFYCVLKFGVVKDGTGLDNPANACFAVLVLCTILWASEAIPLFVTSLFVPFLLVVLRVIRGPEGERLSTPDATKFVFSTIFSPTIMLLIGGFTISSALSKTNIDKLIITRVLSMAGTRPPIVLLAFMGVSCFASMWISNVAAPTLCFTLIRPILRTLPPKSAFAPCLILGIALAANVGGQSSPISSPQNLIALQAMDPPLDWARWFAVSIPVSAISILLIWLLLLVSYRPSRLTRPTPGVYADEEELEGLGEDWHPSHATLHRELEIRPVRPTREPFTAKQAWVTFVCLVTIALWCIAHRIEEYVGDMGIIAILPIVAFFGTGVLKKDDFEHFAWSIVFLAMGGIALGKGVVASGLLGVMDLVIRELLDGFSLYAAVLVLSPVVLVISTFISHTIASVLLVPIAKEVGSNLPDKHANLLIFITGLVCSTGMGMPVSGFPNQTAAAQEDELGETYLTNVDFLNNGVPASVIACLVVVTVGFVLMTLIGL
ncbi:hypothetical protein APHAL10511_000790 [Amanita phalloides]|nr:hypothetical protein APHAL10511_000790 [Amanita phalloides]